MFWCFFKIIIIIEEIENIIGIGNNNIGIENIEINIGDKELDNMKT